MLKSLRSHFDNSTSTRAFLFFIRCCNFFVRIAHGEYWEESVPSRQRCSCDFDMEILIKARARQGSHPFFRGEHKKTLLITRATSTLCTCRDRPPNRNPSICLLRLSRTPPFFLVPANMQGYGGQSSSVFHGYSNYKIQYSLRR